MIKYLIEQTLLDCELEHVQLINEIKESNWNNSNDSSIFRSLTTKLNYLLAH